MPIVSDGKPAAPDECRIRIAAAGDIHCGREGDLERWRAAFEDTPRALSSSRMPSTSRWKRFTGVRR